jgi:serine phosphatase RsbU (regulator of sigma subunit)
LVLAPDHRAALRADYRTALVGYLAERDETGRSRAYELGHAAVEAEIGLLELADVHRSVVDEVLAEDFSRDAVAAAMDFFIESLSTFDMAQRGFWEAHARAEREHALSISLQRSLLPADLPSLPGLEVAVRYLPAGLGSEVGGDWYDVIELAGDRVAFVVGDVMGHGLRQAAVMGQLRLALRSHLLEGRGPVEAVGRLDGLLGHLGDLTTATLVLAVVDRAASAVELVVAGHPWPVLIDPAGRAEFLTAARGRLLGLPGAPDRPVQGPLMMPEDSCLVLYTDGLLERHERAGTDGAELLRSTLDGLGDDAERLCDELTSALVDGPPADDVCLLAVAMRTGSRPPGGPVPFE